MHLCGPEKDWERLKAGKAIAFLKCPNASFDSALVLWALSLALGLFISFFFVCPYDLETWLELTVKDELAQGI